MSYEERMMKDIKTRIEYGIRLNRTQGNWLVEQAEKLKLVKHSLKNSYEEGMVTKESIHKILKKIDK